MGGRVRGNRRVVVGQVAGAAAADVYVADVDRGGCVRGRYGTWRRREMPRRGRPRMYQVRMRVQTVSAHPGVATRVATSANHGRHRRHRQLIVVLLPIGSSSAKITVVMVRLLLLVLELVLLLLILLVLLLLLVGRG